VGLTRLACLQIEDIGRYSTLVADHLRHLRFCKKLEGFCWPHPRDFGPKGHACKPVQINEQVNTQVCVPVVFVGIGAGASGTDNVIALSENVELDGDRRSRVIRTPLGEVKVTLEPHGQGAEVDDVFYDDYYEEEDE
jgi:hypothetical protein